MQAAISHHSTAASCTVSYMQYSLCRPGLDWQSRNMS